MKQYVEVDFQWFTKCSGLQLGWAGSPCRFVWSKFFTTKGRRMDISWAAPWCHEKHAIICISQVSPSHRWAQRWSLEWQYIIHPCPRSHSWEVWSWDPRLSILKPYHLHHAGHYFILEISPRARFFIYFLWAITGSSHALKCQHVSMSAFQNLPLPHSPNT